MNGFDANLVVQWLGTYAIHSTALIGLVWIACRALPRLGHGTRDLLWKLGLVGGLVSATVQVGAGVRPLAPAVELSMPATQTDAPPRAAVLAPAPASARPPTIARSPIDSSNPEPVEVELAGPGPIPGPSVDAPVLAQLDHESVSGPGVDASLLGVGLWVLFASVRLARLARGYGRLHRGLARRRPVSDSRVLDAFARIRAKAGLDRPVLLSVVEELGSPVALVTSEICVSPRVLSELSTEQLESVLAHELAHVQRRDPLWLGIAAVVEAVFFFQPLNRVARRSMQESAEYLCDDRAVTWTGSGLALARSLAEVAAWRGQAATSPLVAAMVRREGPLVRRVGRLLDEGRALDREPGHARAVAVSVLGIAGLVALAPGLVSAAGPDEDDEGITVMVVGEGEGPEVVRVDSSELEAELAMELGELAVFHDPDDDRRSRAKRKRKRARKDRRHKSRRARGGEEAERGNPQIVIVPRVQVPEIRVPNVSIPEMQVPEMRFVVPPMPPMPPEEHGEEWEKWEREVEREMKKLEKEWEGHAEQWEREHERAMRDHERATRERERAVRDRARAMRERERAHVERQLERERERARAKREREREQARRHGHGRVEQGPSHEVIERRLLEEAERAQAEAQRQQRRAEQLRRKAEQLRRRRELGGDAERL